MIRRILKGRFAVPVLLALFALLAIPGVALARAAIYDAWNAYYPSSTTDDAIKSVSGGNPCQLCHRDSGGGNPWNPYGWSIRQRIALGDTNEQAFAFVEGLNADADPGAYTNLQEITAGNQPGWTPGNNNTIYWKAGTIDYNQPVPANLTTLTLDPSAGPTPTPTPTPPPAPTTGVGPHGGYQDVSGGLADQCAACHRVHQGTSVGKLLKAESNYALCLTCHNGAGSRLDVLDGVKLGSTVSPDSGIVRAADTADINISVAPTALFYAPLKTSVGAAIADDGGVQVDETTGANNVGLNDMTLLPAIPAVGDAYYFGAASKFTNVLLDVSTAGAGTWTLTWKYYNGATWANLVGVNDATNGFKVAGQNEVRFDPPANWAQTAVASKRFYWIRAEVTAYTSVTTQPKGAQTWPAGFPQEFTVAVRNRTAGIAAVALSIVSDSNAAKFNTSILKDATLNVPAAVGGVPGVAYTTLTTRAKAAAVANDSNLTTVRATFNALTADVKVQTRVGDATSLGVLNGGGFRYMAGVAVTSRHNADPADNSLYPWGYNANTGQNTNALASPLQCTSCHNPHGTNNYRILKEKVNTVTVVVKAWYPDGGAGAFVKDEGAPGLQTGAPANKYTKEYYGSAGGGGAPNTGGGSLASLCGACHTAYPAIGASQGYSEGGVTHFRHATEAPYTWWINPDTGVPVPNNPETLPITGFPALRLASNVVNDNDIVTCLTCHRVHGSTSTMKGYAVMAQFGGLADNDLTPSQTADSISTLLYTDNRGMCEACHQW